MPDRPEDIRISEAQLRKLMQETVKETLTKMGVDYDNPLEVQRDFQHLREWRLATQVFQRKGILTVLTTLVVGAVSLIYVGLSTSIGGG